MFVLRGRSLAARFPWSNKDRDPVGHEVGLLRWVGEGMLKLCVQVDSSRTSGTRKMRHHGVLRRHTYLSISMLHIHTSGAEAAMCEGFPRLCQSRGRGDCRARCDGRSELRESVIKAEPHEAIPYEEQATSEYSAEVHAGVHGSSRVVCLSSRHAGRVHLNWSALPAYAWSAGLMPSLSNIGGRGETATTIASVDRCTEITPAQRIVA